MEPDPDHERSTAGSWLRIALALALIGMLFVGATNGRDRADPNCLPDMPSAPTTSQTAVWPMAEGSYTVGDGFNTPGREHYGVDLAAAAGTPIYAATAGKVMAAGPASGFGNWIIIDTPSDPPTSTVYGHMTTEGLVVKGRPTQVGQQVVAGQQIAVVGSAGQSSGPHLHFEVWLGGRLSGGTPTDPLPWLNTHAGRAPDRADGDTRLVAQPRGTAEPEMAALPAHVGSEQQLQIDTIRLVRAIATRFPDIQTIHGWRASGDDLPDHGNGVAADLMIPEPTTADGKKLGDQVADYIAAHANDFRLVYLIWQRKYRPAVGETTTMADKGSTTANHQDHIHVSVEGSGFPQPDQIYGPAPALETATAPRSGCSPVSEPSALGLRSGSVPAAFEPWILRASGTCPEATAPILAAQLENESDFKVDAHNDSSGADGPSQFIPTTWAAKAVDGDGDGRKDTRSIPDAVMSQAGYDCELAGIAKAALAEGTIQGSLTELWLSMYNCGPGATLASGGVCPNPETRAYVVNIVARARDHFAAPTAGSRT